jgi:hypothetical protein
MPLSLQNSPQRLAWSIESCGTAFNAVCVSIGGNLPFEEEQWSKPQLMVVTSPEFGTESTLPLKRNMVETRASPRLEFALELRVSIGPVFQLGWNSCGLRRTVPITGGTFRGPRISGRVLPGGADWQFVDR